MPIYQKIQIKSEKEFIGVDNANVEKYFPQKLPVLEQGLLKVVAV